MKGNIQQGQNQRKNYQKYESDEEDHHPSDDQNYYDSSSDKNSAHMGSSPENSDSNEENNYKMNNQPKQQQTNLKDQKKVTPVQGFTNQSNYQSNPKNIQMTNIRQSTTQGRKGDERQFANQQSSDEEEEIPTNYTKKSNLTNANLKSQNLRSDQQRNNPKNEHTNYANKQNKFKDSSDEDEDVEDSNFQNDVEDQNWKKKLIQNKQEQKKEININQISQNTKQAQAKPISKLASNIKGKQQKHVKMVEEDEDSDNSQEKQKKQESDDEDEVTYQQKTSRLKEEKEIRQRLSDERKKELEKKKKKKSRKFDAEENEEGDDDDEDDDEDDDSEYDYDYDDYESESKRKREEYDFSNTLQHWIGFVIILVFMSILYFVMIQRSFNSYSSREYNSNKKNANKEITLFPRNNYPLDINFNYKAFKQAKDQEDRRQEALYKDNSEPLYNFSLEISEQETRNFESFLQFRCKKDCESLLTYEIHQGENNNSNEQKRSISYQDMMKEYNCDGERESYFKGKCSESDNCFNCSPFTHNCYNCYDQQVLSEKKCQTSCGSIKSVVNDFCIGERKDMNLQVIKGLQHNLYLLHTPEIISETDEKTNAKKDGDIKNIDETKQKVEQKKYPFIIVLNDSRYTQDDIFLSNSIQKYFDKAFVLSLPYFKQMYTASQIHNLVADILKNSLPQSIIQRVDFYAFMGYGLTGHLASLIALNQEDNRESYWGLKVTISTASFEKRFVTIINQDENSFQQAIQNKDSYYLDNLFHYHEERQKQIKSVADEYKPHNSQANDQQSKLRDYLNFYLEQSFDEILLHYYNQKLNLLKF